MSIEDDVKHAKSIRSKKDAINFLRRRNGRWDRINERRAELIDKDVYTNSLTPEEKKELESLQALTGRLVELAHPRRPAIRKLDKILKKLEAAIGAKNEDRS